MLGLLTALALAAPVVVVDGERVSTTEVSPGGLVVFARHVRLWLPGDRDWTLTTEWSKSGELLLVFDQDRTLIGVAVNDAAKSAKQLASLNLTSVRGLAVDAWSPALAAVVRRMPQPSCLAIDSAPVRLRLETLPVALRCLDLEFEQKDEQLQLDLSRFSQLEWLEVKAAAHARLKAIPSSVRRASVNDLRLERPALAHLATLESLELVDVELPELTGTFPGLAELEVSFSSRTVFKHFEAPRLSSIKVRGGALVASELTLPALTEAVFLDVEWSDASVAAFKERHPKAVVVTDWTRYYRHKLGKADRFRVRSGGVCHRQKGREKTLFDSHDPAELARLLAVTELRFEESRGFCMCCGGPTMEFFREGVLFQSVSFQHGEALRWSEGLGDVPLGNDALVRFLADHEVAQPLEELTRSELQRAAVLSWRAACLSLLPGRLHDVFRRGASTELFEELRSELPDRRSRLRVLLSLHGARRASLTEAFQFEEGIERELATFSAEEVMQVATAAPRAPELEEGLFRLLFSAKVPAPLLDPMLGRLVVDLSADGLARPWAEDRVKTIGGLARVPDERATLLLRRVLAGEVPYSRVDDSSPSGAVWVRYASSPFEAALPRVPSTTRLTSRDVRVLAAWALVFRGAAVRDELVALRAQVHGEDADLLDAALSRLASPDGGTSAQGRHTPGP